MMLPGNVIISDSLSSDLQRFLDQSNFTQVAILVDENTRKHCLPLLSKSLNDLLVVEIPSGEHHKNIDSCNLIWESLLKTNLDRNSLLINLGGGVICDLGGFCASTYKRGIEFINIPTTLLAQVDASIGGKTGFNFNGLKNQVGVFSEPIATIINYAFLETLPEREIKSGFAEVIKHAIIADANHFYELETFDFNQADWNSIIPTSINIKNQIVTKDPFEEDLRKSLNFGHSIGHALESFLLQQGSAITHGEAIAAGMVCESFISSQKLNLAAEVQARINNLIIRHFPMLGIPKESHEGIIQLILGDKKNRLGNILMSLIPNLGNVEVNVQVTHEEIEASLSYYVTLKRN